MDISVVIPVYNEKGNVPELHQQTVAALTPLKRSFEIIFVDDASNDGTFDALSALPAPIKIIRLRRNRGQTAALDAGIKAAQGKIVVTMDGDLQNDPVDIPNLIEKLETEKLDVVSGWRKYRKDPFGKRFISKGAKFLRGLLIQDGVHDSGCTLKAYHKKCFDTIDLYGEMHRFIVALLRMKGFKVGEMVVRHHPRRYGKTKYNFTRTIKGFLDMISIWFWKKFANRPLHLLGGVGFLMMFLGIFRGLWSVYLKIFRHADLSDTSLTVLTMLLFFGGLSMFVAGILADMVSKTYYNTSNDQVYLIEKVIDKQITSALPSASPARLLLKQVFRQQTHQVPNSDKNIVKQ